MLQIASPPWLHATIASCVFGGVQGDSWEDAAHRLRQSNVLAAPVVDGSGVLVAVLNPSDLLQVRLWLTLSPFQLETLLGDSFT